MTCKECIHYEACKSLFQHYGDELAVEALETDGLCVYFTDKSLYIKLPCKIGDTAYHIKGRQLEIKAVIVFIEEDDKPYCKIDCSYVFDNKTFPWFFYEDEIGETVFLTREEAEAALKEREK